MRLDRCTASRGSPAAASARRALVEQVGARPLDAGYAPRRRSDAPARTAQARAKQRSAQRRPRPAWCCPPSVTTASAREALARLRCNTLRRSAPTGTATSTRSAPATRRGIVADLVDDAELERARRVGAPAPDADRHAPTAPAASSRARTSRRSGRRRSRRRRRTLEIRQRCSVTRRHDTAARRESARSLPAADGNAQVLGHPVAAPSAAR